MAKGWLTTEGHTLGGLLDERLAADPDSLFLNCCGTPYTAAALNDEAGRIAGALAELGVRRGSTVATILENGPAAVLSWVAIQRLGAIFVPVNTALKGELLRHQLSDASASVVIVQEDLLSRPAEILDSIDSVEHLVVVGRVPGLSVKASLHAWDDLRTASPWSGTLVRPSDLAGIVYTGGTTGPSKGCALSHGYHVSIARHIIASWNRTPEDVVWSPLPLFHFNAISNMLTGTLLTGGQAHISRRFSVSRFWPEINAAGATIASLLGSLAVMVARADDTPLARNSGAPAANTTLRLLTGAPIPPDIDELIRTRWGIEIFSAAYGTTEASLIS